MHLLIDALSVNNFSGRHVLQGHVRQLRQSLGDWRFSMLVQSGRRSLATDCDVEPVELPIDGSAWRRVLATSRTLPALSRSLQADALFTPAGMLTVGCPLPQVVLAQNPWPLVGLARGVGRLRTWLQRNAYRRAQRRAALMVYNSRYMQDLYAQTCGHRQGPSVVAYQGIDEAYFAERHPPPLEQRRDLLLVSVMAAHKAVEDAVRAFARTTVPGAKLRLVGPWPDPSYRAAVDRVARECGVAERVDFAGELPLPALHEAYRQARAFVLLSRCESFGIPAIEAQSQGTPTIVADGTAAPEIAGHGGVVVVPGDIDAAGRAMSELLSNDTHWRRLSQAASANAQRFRFAQCSVPLIDALRRVLSSPIRP
jgi:glycosyltransferase involved in cell wall biosynthesis